MIASIIDAFRIDLSATMSLEAHGFTTIPASEPIKIPAADHGDKVLNLILSECLADEISNAMVYVKDNVSEQPRGIACDDVVPIQQA